MSYEQKIADYSRRKIDLVKLRLPYCSNTYGAAPCTATAVEKCYKTFPTCLDKANYANTGRVYKFINERLPLSAINDYELVYPFINNINDLATEIKEADTVIKRLKVNMHDDKDNDINIDPHIDERMPAKGNFWLKFIARNRNYGRGTIEHWQGFEGIAEDQFQSKFAGKIDNITYDNGATIEAVDFLKELSKIKYPLKLDVALAEDVIKVHQATSQTTMLALDALIGDYAERTDFVALSGVNITSEIGGIGTLQGGTYWISIIAKDGEAKNLGKHPPESQLVLAGGTGQINISWTGLANAYYYNVYARSDAGSWVLKGTTGGSTSFTVYNLDGEEEDPPDYAERYFELVDSDPSVLANWEAQYGVEFTMLVYGSQASSLPLINGYVRIDKEIIYYSTRSTARPISVTLYGIKRAQFDTKSERHYADTILAILYYTSAPQNPYAVMQTLLGLAGIKPEYISSNLQSYAEDYAGDPNLPKVSLKPILKDVKFSRIFYDLVRLMNCMCWVNEEGKIDILSHGWEPGLQELTDEANIVAGSVKIDFNEGSRFTRWGVIWNRFDMEESIDESKAYSRMNITVDATAESNNEYGDEVEDMQYTVWFNDDEDETKISNYLNDLLAARKTRTRNAQEIVTLEVELKDDVIKVGDVVYLSTKYLQDQYGNDYNRVKFRLIKKEAVDESRLAFKLIRKF